METKFSLSGYARNSWKLMSFYCDCKKCDNKSTDWLSHDEWLDIAYVLVDSDLVTRKEFKQLNHLAVTQWNDIDKIYFHGYELSKGAN